MACTLTARMCAKSDVNENDYDRQESKPPCVHQAGVRNGSCSLRFETGDGSNHRYHDRKAEPYEPVHELVPRKICATGKAIFGLS